MGSVAQTAAVRTNVEAARRDRRTVPQSDDRALLKEINATHNHDAPNVDTLPILHVIENIMHHVSLGIGAQVTSTQQEETHLEKAVLALNGGNGPGGQLEGLGDIIHKISCEMSCKCSGGAEGTHQSTMAILNTLSGYPWGAKLVISTAVLAANYGQFFLVAQLFSANSLAKAVAILKQLPDITEHYAALKPRFDAINILMKAILDVTKTVLEFNRLPTKYLSDETPPLSTALTYISLAVYWTLSSILACALRIETLQSTSYALVASNTEIWELSNLTQNLSSINENLKAKLVECHKYVEEQRVIEYYNNLVLLFKTPQVDNIRILQMLICLKDETNPLLDGTKKTKVKVDVLKGKTVYFLVSDLEPSQEELVNLVHLYQQSRAKKEFHYEIVWIPIVAQWDDESGRKFIDLQKKMPWYTLSRPSLLEPAVVKYIRETWQFSKDMILVMLDQQGKVACPNALDILWVRGNLADPLTMVVPRDESWRLEILVEAIDQTILKWIKEEKYICLYGGDDINWIRKFTTTTKEAAKAAGISIELVYVGRRTKKETVKKINVTIAEEKLSHAWTDHASIWLFWARLESLCNLKIQHGKTIKNDQVMQELFTLLTYDESGQGWALFSKGSTEMVKAKGEAILDVLHKFAQWKEEVTKRGFVAALSHQLRLIVTSQHHCNHLLLKGSTGGNLGVVICMDCGRPMEKYYMYKCCTD